MRGTLLVAMTTRASNIHIGKCQLLLLPNTILKRNGLWVNLVLVHVASVFLR